MLLMKCIIVGHRSSQEDYRAAYRLAGVNFTNVHKRLDRFLYYKIFFFRNGLAFSGTGNITLVILMSDLQNDSNCLLLHGVHRNFDCGDRNHPTS